MAKKHWTPTWSTKRRPAATLPREIFDYAHQSVEAEAARRGLNVEKNGNRVRAINGKKVAVAAVPVARRIDGVVTSTEGGEVAFLEDGALAHDAEIVVSTNMNGGFWICTRQEWEEQVAQ